MRKLGVIVLTAALGATAYVAVPAQASVSGTSFCSTLQSTFDEFGSSTGDSNLGDLSALSDGLRKAAKSAPKKVKKAMRKIAKYYDLLAGVSSENPISSADDAEGVVGDYFKAQTTFYAYIEDHCEGLTPPTFPTSPTGDQ